jgi:tRNA (guanine26-N2/guanine27-N2)-dimethyltransferase
VGEKHNKGTAIKYTPGHGPVVPQACPETGARFLLGGPLWAEPIHHHQWVAQLLQDVDSRREQYARWGASPGQT